MRRGGGTRGAARRERDAGAAAAGVAATAAVLQNQELLCAIFERGVTAGHFFNTGVEVWRLERVCRAWRVATATCGLWTAALAREFPAAAADGAAGGAPVAGETPAAAAARAHRAWHRRYNAHSRRQVTVYPPERESPLVVLMREYRFELNVRDASGAARLAMSFHYGQSQHSAINLVRNCNYCTRLALHAEADAQSLLALVAPDGGGLRASLVAQRRVQPRPDWPKPDDHAAPPDAYEASPLFFNAPVHVSRKADHGGYAAVRMPAIKRPHNDEEDEYDYDHDIWLHHGALQHASDYEPSDTDEDEDEDDAVERRWCRISPHVTVLLPVPRPAGGPSRVVRKVQCWLSFVTSLDYEINDTQDKEMLALLRALDYWRVM